MCLFAVVTGWIFDDVTHHPPLHHTAPRPALSARGRLGGEGREEGGLVGAAPPLHYTAPCPALGG